MFVKLAKLASFSFVCISIRSQFYVHLNSHRTCRTPQIAFFFRFRVDLQRFFFAAYFFQFIYFPDQGSCRKESKKENRIWVPQDVPKSVTKNVPKNVVWGLVLGGHKCRD